MLNYIPNKIKKPAKVLDVPSAWAGLESILEDILDTFKVKRESALEFGVEYGYSTVALSNFFSHVTGVDTFEGDSHIGVHPDSYEREKESLKSYSNITLVKSDFKDFIAKEQSTYDLIHVDIEHLYQSTYDCGNWAAKHASVVLFHDTVSFIEVFKAVSKISQENNMTFYSYPNNFGLGILVRR